MNRTVGNRNKLTVHVVQKWNDKLTSPFSVNIREEKIHSFKRNKIKVYEFPKAANVSAEMTQGETQ